MPGYEEKVEVSASVVQRGSVEVQAAEPLQNCMDFTKKKVKTTADAEGIFDHYTRHKLWSCVTLHVVLPISDFISSSVIFLLGLHAELLT
jgi:hypothetical protein